MSYFSLPHDQSSFDYRAPSRPGPRAHEVIDELRTIQLSEYGTVYLTPPELERIFGPPHADTPCDDMSCDVCFPDAGGGMLIEELLDDSTLDWLRRKGQGMTP